jgi:hypothetical protein
MKTILFAIVAFFAISAAGAADRARPEELDRWMAYYYADPRPDEVATALRAIENQGLFEKDSVQAPLSGFFAEIFRTNPDRVAEWIKPYRGVPNRHIIYSALWMADSVQSKAALESLAKAASPDEAKRLKELISSAPPTAASMELDSPASLDYLWGSFMASGSDAPVLRLIDQMKRANTRGNISESLIGGAAQWSVSANARQHSKVLQIATAKAATADPETKRILREILAGIEGEKAKK